MAERYAEVRYAERRYVKRRYAERRYAECNVYCIEGISETPNASADFYCQSNTNDFT
jgi:hypothetical protein